ncbi:hypothetical protein MRX96_047860 [Rhipicephalus microplus]
MIYRCASRPLVPARPRRSLPACRVRASDRLKKRRSCQEKRENTRLRDESVKERDAKENEKERGFPPGTVAAVARFTALSGLLGSCTTSLSLVHARYYTLGQLYSACFSLRPLRPAAGFLFLPLSSAFRFHFCLPFVPIPPSRPSPRNSVRCRRRNASLICQLFPRVARLTLRLLSAARSQDGKRRLR